MGYLTRVTSDYVDDRLAAQQPTPDVNLFVNPVWSDPSPSFPLNPNCWAYDFDLTCLCPYNNTPGFLGRSRGGTLVTPRHALTAKHYGLGNIGALLWYMDRNNVGAWYSVTAREYIPELDLEIVQFDRDVAHGISFAKVLPDDWRWYFDNNGKGLPYVFTNVPRIEAFGDAACGGKFYSSKQVGVRTIADLHYHSDFTDTWLTLIPGVALRDTALLPICGGDSGQPSFIFLSPNDPVILSPGVPYLNKDAINAKIASMSGNGGYQLTEISLSDFMPTSAQPKGARKSGILDSV